MAGENSFDARYGRIIRKHGVSTAPSALYVFQGQLGLSAQETWLVGALLSYKWTEENPYPSVHTLAKQSGIPRSTIMTYLKLLKEKGIVEVVPRYGKDGRQTSSSYNFDGLFDKLEQFILAEEGSTHATPEGRPVDRDSRMARLKEDPPEEETEREERSDVDRLAEKVAWAMRKPGRRDEVAQKLRALPVHGDRLERAVHGAIEELRVGEGEGAFWHAVSASLGR